MKPDRSLKLYTHYMPAQAWALECNRILLEASQTRPPGWSAEGNAPKDVADALNSLVRLGDPLLWEDLAVFDCRALPTAFVLDTGVNVWLEQDAKGPKQPPLQLPYPDC